MDAKGANDVPQRVIGCQHGVSLVSLFNSKQRIYSRDQPRYPRKLFGNMSKTNKVFGTIHDQQTLLMRHVLSLGSLEFTIGLQGANDV